MADKAPDLEMNNHLSLASKAGRTHAEAEHSLGVTVPTATVDPLGDEEDQRALVFAVTGQKLDVNSDEANELLAAYEDAYFDRWEEITSEGYPNG